MKRILLLTPAALMSALALLITGCTGSGQSEKSAKDASPVAQKEGKAIQYTCSMHPEVVQDKPGDCPKCGMKLVEKR